MQQRILITGAGGFLGKKLIEVLKKDGQYQIKAVNHKTCDLTQLDNAISACKNIDVVVHGAGLVLSRVEQLKRPAEVLYQNVLTALNIAEASKVNGVKKLIFISSITAYGQSNKTLKEADLWKGAPQGSMPYGFSKRMTDIMADVYSGYKIKTSTIIFPNLYGPNDKFNFNPPPLVPSAIKQIHKAKLSGQKLLEAGNNGHEFIDLLFIDDAVEALRLVLKKSIPPKLMNIGSGKSSKKSKVFELAARALGFEGKILWKKPKQKSKSVRQLNVTLMKKELNWEPKFSLEEGIKLTVKNYNSKK